MSNSDPSELATVNITGKGDASILKSIVKQRYLTFKVANELYALSINHVKEMIAYMKITLVPKTPAHVKGVINLRGAVIPVVDVRLKFCLTEKTIDLDSAIIISEIDGINIGFIVDSVDDVIPIDESQLKPTPEFGQQINTDFIENVAQIDQDIIFILNLNELFESEELIDIKSYHQNNHQFGE